MSNIETKLQNGKAAIGGELKKRLFDIIAAVIVISLIAASLGLFGLIDFTLVGFFDFIVSWLPYFIAVILLNTDLYKKGVFVGKGTDKFNNVIDKYSNFANNLSGKQVKDLYPFCDKYNEDAIINLRTQILREEGITYEDFDKDRTEIIDGNEITFKALKTLTKEELLKLGYTKRQIKVIKAAKKAKVKGLTVSILLSSIDVKDVTDLGSDEKKLSKRHIIISTIRYLFITILLSITTIKSIYDLGWVAVIFVIFRVTYCVAGCYMSYFRGYDDITILLANHFLRKTDILKMYVNYVPSQEEDFE